MENSLLAIFDEISCTIVEERSDAERLTKGF